MGIYKRGIEPKEPLEQNMYLQKRYRNTRNIEAEEVLRRRGTGAEYLQKRD